MCKPTTPAAEATSRKELLGLRRFLTFRYLADKTLVYGPILWRPIDLPDVRLRLGGAVRGGLSHAFKAIRERL
jgi:hypothetical protein